MLPSHAARNYARGLVQASGGGPAAEALARELRSFLALLEANRELDRALGNGALPLEKRTGLLRAVLKAAQAPPLLEGFLALVLGNGHHRGLGVIVAAVEKAAAEARGTLRADLRTAQPASAEQIAAIAAALGKALGRKVEVSHQVDPSLIGGFVARAQDLVFDASIAHQLEKLRGELVRG